MKAEDQKAEDQLDFWLRHVRIGNWLAAGSLAVVSGHLLLTPHGSNRPMLWALVVAAAVVSVIGAFVPWAAIFRRGDIEYALFAWSLLIVAFVMVAVVLDGGSDSPIQLLLILPIIFAGMAYRPALVVIVGLVIVLGRVAAMALLEAFDPAKILLRSGTLVIIAVMCVLIARSHREQHRRLAETAALLHDMAHLDPMTGCVNRRAFEDELQQTLAAGNDVGLLLFDVDRFKQVNDDRGHLAGDQVLVRVADELRRNARSNDLVARIGGDEFALLLPGASAEACDRTSMRFRETLRLHELFDGVTVSVGAAHTDAAGHDRERLIGMADDELYRAKTRSHTRGRGIVGTG